VRLSGPQINSIETGSIRLDPGDNTLLIVWPLPDGDYTVEWRAVLSDGHKTNGTYVFKS
jgi:copper resistance protein C